MVATAVLVNYFEPTYRRMSL